MDSIDAPTVKARARFAAPLAASLAACPAECIEACALLAAVDTELAAALTDDVMPLRYPLITCRQYILDGLAKIETSGLLIQDETAHHHENGCFHWRAAAASALILMSKNK